MGGLAHVTFTLLNVLILGLLQLFSRLPVLVAPVYSSGCDRRATVTLGRSLFEATWLQEWQLRPP